MSRFFVEQQQIEEQQINIVGEMVHYMTSVLRLTSGEEIAVCTGDGYEHIAKLTEFQKDKIIGEIIRSSEVKEETQTQVTLYQGLPKSDKLELIIQKCTELGISRIVPVSTERAIVKLDGSKAAKKTQRWQKIAQEASQQSKRVTTPTIAEPMSWKEALSDMAKQQLNLVMWEDEQTLGMKTYLSQHELPAQIGIIIGPEGGLSQQEVEQLRHNGVVSVSLGKRILRTETAGMAALTMLLYHTGDLG